MPIILHCPVSGAAFKLPSFSIDCISVTAPHPLLSCNLSELTKLDSPLTTSDYHILLCAWLEQLSRIGIAHWSGVLQPLTFSFRWHQQEFDHLTTLITWLVRNRNHPALQVIPQLRLDSKLDAEAVQNWRESCQVILSSYTTYFDIAETLRVKELREQAERLLSQPRIDDSQLPVAVRKLRSRKSYLDNSFLYHENQEACELVKKICLSPQSYEVPTIQKAKEFCLDYLLESGIENANDKLEVIHILDAALVNKIGMANLLGCGNDNFTSIQSSITASYSIERNGQTFLNGAAPKVVAAIQRVAIQSGLGNSEPAIPTYTSEPVRDQFKSQLGYQIAHRQWKLQHSRRKEDVQI